MGRVVIVRLTDWLAVLATKFSAHIPTERDVTSVRFDCSSSLESAVGVDLDAGVKQEESKFRKMTFKNKSTKKKTAEPSDAEKMAQMKNCAAVCSHVLAGAKIDVYQKAKRPTKKHCGLPMVLCEACAESAEPVSHVKLVHRECLENVFKDDMLKYRAFLETTSRPSRRSPRKMSCRMF